MRVKDKIVVLTGAASGIGRAIAILFAKEGAIQVLSDIDEEGLKENNGATGEDNASSNDSTEVT
ncbi:MAG: SDR family NAD(P)-dependent oxidoreductase, partial [Candidatus Hermodarchaeota archaeon]